MYYSNIEPLAKLGASNFWRFCQILQEALT